MAAQGLHVADLSLHSFQVLVVESLLAYHLQCNLLLCGEVCSKVHLCKVATTQFSLDFVALHDRYWIFAVFPFDILL